MTKYFKLMSTAYSIHNIFSPQIWLNSVFVNVFKENLTIVKWNPTIFEIKMLKNEFLQKFIEHRSISHHEC